MTNNNEIIKQIQEMGIETIKDAKILKQIETQASELLNSQDTSLKILALTIQNKLNTNPHYQNFKQQKQKIEEEAEQKAEKLEQYRKLDINHTNHNVEVKKKEAQRKAEAEEHKTIETFNKLSLQQQKLIIELEKEFELENQQAIREFLLDTNKSTPQNFANILNSELGQNIVKVENDFISIDEKATTEQAKSVSQKSEKVGDVAVQLNNINAAVVSYSTMNAANIKIVDNSIPEKVESTKKLFNMQNLDEAQEKNIKLQIFVSELSDEVLQKHISKLKSLEKLDNNEKEKKLDKLNEILKRKIQEALEKHNISLDNVEDRKAFIEILVRNNPKEKVDIIAKSLNLKTELETVRKEEKELEKLAKSADIDAPDTPQVVKRYDPSVWAQNEREGVAYELAKKVRERYSQETDSPEDNNNPGSPGQDRL